MSKWVCHNCGKIHVSEEVPEVCEGCGVVTDVKLDGVVVAKKITKNWASQHPLGPVGKKAYTYVPDHIIADLKKEIEIDGQEAVKYITYSKIAKKAGYAEIGAYFKEIAIEKITQAGEELELLGEDVSISTEENLRKAYEQKIEDGARKTGFSKRATATGYLHGEHELLHEIARDEGDIGLALGNLLKRYFNVDIDD